MRDILVFFSAGELISPFPQIFIRTMIKPFCIPIFLATVAAGMPAALFAAPASPPPAATTADEPAREALRVFSIDYYSWDRSLSIRFSDAVDSAEIAKYITCSPEVTLQFPTSSESGARRYQSSRFYIHGNFEAGKVYTVRINGALAGNKTTALGDNVVHTFSVPDRSSSLDFLSKGKFFPLKAKDFSLPLSLVNCEEIELYVREAYADRNVEFAFEPWDSDFSRQVFSRELKPPQTRNKDATFSVELEKIGILRRPGMYSVRVHDGDSYYRQDRRLIVVTDLALQAARNGDELAVVLKSLSENTVVPHAKVSVYSQKKRLLASAKTDADGFVKLALQPLADEEDAPALIFAESGDDRTFLSLRELAAQRQSRKFAYAGGSAYVFCERGICRPGEKIHLFASLRDPDERRAQGGVPAEFLVSEPQGKDFLRIPVVGDKFGFYKTRIEIPAFAATGSYSVELRIPGQENAVYGKSRFSVAEYVPDSLELSLRSTKSPGAIQVNGNAAYYFGLPLAGGEIRFTPDAYFKNFVPKKKAFEEFLFGKESPGTIEKWCEEFKIKSDEKGSFSAAFPYLKFAEPVTAPVAYLVSASASGAAGSRAVSAWTSQLVHHADYYWGTREKSASEKGRVFEVCALSPEEERVNLAGKQFKAELFRQEWVYALRETRSGAMRCEWFETSLPSGTLTFDGAETELAFHLTHAGNYTLKISDASGTVLHTRTFWHYYGETGARSTNASELSFSLDRESYLPGETAKITFESPVAGSAVLLAGAEKIEGVRIIDVQPGKNTVELDVPAAMSGGSRFFSLNICGKNAREDVNSPQRLFGVGVLPVNQRARKIAVKTSLPEVTRPGEKATVNVELADCDGKPLAGTVQLWAVDRGVLSLTAFKTPNAFPHFFGTYACPYEFGDNYGDFYPLLALDKKLIGGGASAIRKFLDDGDKSEKSAVVVLDTLSVSESGKASAEITLPDFDGAMRVMAFALNDEKTGSGDTNVIVRDPVAIKLSIPRALSSGDAFEVVGEFFNADLPDGEFSWRLLCAGEEKASGRSGLLKKGEKVVVREPMIAGTQSGALPYTFEVFDAQGKRVAREQAVVSVRPAVPARDFVSVRKIQKGEELSLPNQNSFGGITIGAPALMLSGALEWLEEYPYGCLEQTTAAAFPFLATESLVRSGVLPSEYAESSAGKIRSALARLLTMRRYDGSYSMWPDGGSTWEAGSLFAFHFELEADAAGFTMDAERRAEICRYLVSFTNWRSNSSLSRAYAIYLLALAGDSRAIGAARDLLASSKPDGAFADFLAASALVKSGYAAEGMRTILPLLEGRFWARESSSWDGCLDSPIRRSGVTLRILSEIAPSSPANAQIAQYLSTELLENGHWGSTQKNAWAAYGLAAFFANEPAGTERALVKVDGEEVPFSASMTIPVGKSVSVKNTGTRPIYAFVRTREVPKEVKAISAGFKISREYLDASGKPVTSCESGDLLIVKIRVRADEYCESAVISDLLPGCLEIEDETLMTRYRANPETRNSNTGSFRELARERRFDRFLAFGEFYPNSQGDWTELSYRVRAVSRGKFVIPPVQVESMYEGEKCAVGVSEAKIFEVK